MKAKILTTQTEKIQGVKGRDTLDPDEIYIFLNVYPNTCFHMQTVPFPLEIAFLDKDFGILEIATMDPEVGTAKAPDKTYHAVEAPKGYFESNNLKTGSFWKEVSNKILIK